MQVRSAMAEREISKLMQECTFKPKITAKARAVGASPSAQRGTSPRCHVCTGTGLTAATSAPGLDATLPHLHPPGLGLAAAGGAGGCFHQRNVDWKQKRERRLRCGGQSRSRA
jgi:hypothetical protein